MIENAQPTFPQGYSNAPEIYTGDLEPPNKKRISQVATLADLAEDNVLYTHATFFTIGGLDVDPVQVYFAENKLPSNRRPFMLETDKPLFGNLPDPWANLIFAVEKDIWPELAQALDIVSVIDRSSNTYWQAIRQEMLLPDIWALNRVTDSSKLPPSISVQCYGISGNAACWYFDPPTTPLAPAIPSPRATAV